MENFIDGDGSNDGYIPQNPGPSPSSSAAGTGTGLSIAVDSMTMTEADSLVITSSRSTSGQSTRRRQCQATSTKFKRVAINLENVTVIEGVDGAPAKYKCNYCKKIFKTKSHIKYHDFCNVTPTDRLRLLPFKCEECGQGFISKSHYDYHRQAHSGLRPFQCSLCTRAYAQKNKLIRHLKSHTPEKLFHCQKCHKKFSTASYLKIHQATHNLESGNTVDCHICGKSFKAQLNLKKHLVRHSSVPEVNHFPCSKCGLKFNFKWTRARHEKMHLLDKPHACTLCRKAFKSKKDLRRHLVTHSGLRPYACLLCFTQFRRSDNLGRHIRSAHKLPESMVKSLLVSTTPATLEAIMRCCDETSASIDSVSLSKEPVPSTSAAAISVQQVEREREAEVQAYLRLRKRALTLIDYRRDDPCETETVPVEVEEHKLPMKKRPKTRVIPSTIVRPVEDEEILPEPEFEIQTIMNQEENLEMKPDVTESEQMRESLEFSVFEAMEVKMMIKDEPVDLSYLPEVETDEDYPSTAEESVIQYKYTVKEEPGSTDHQPIMTQTISVYSTPTEINYTVKEEKIESQTQRKFIAENGNSSSRPTNRFLSLKSERDLNSYVNGNLSSGPSQFYVDLAREWGMAPLSLPVVKAEPADPNEEIPDACCVVEVE